MRRRLLPEYRRGYIPGADKIAGSARVTRIFGGRHLRRRRSCGEPKSARPSSLPTPTSERMITYACVHDECVRVRREKSDAAGILIGGN